MTAQQDNGTQLRLHAALDGELDAAGMLAFENDMARDPKLAAEYKRFAALQGVMRENLPRHTASPQLRQRIAALAPPMQSAGRQSFHARSRRSWLAYAATALIAAGVGSAATVLTLDPLRPPNPDSEIVAAHMRGLLAATPVDVVSSDRHTVKPWFDQHLGVSPPVPNLSAQGYQLVGGRVDVSGEGPAPTLVYKAREHLVSVTAAARKTNSWRVLSTSAGGAYRRGGYTVTRWADDDFFYWAVSDIERTELEAFAAAFKNAQPPRQ